MGYLMKEETTKLIKDKYQAKYFCKEVGITSTYMSMIMSRKYHCSKPVAYCLTKLIDNNAELEKFFDKV